MTTETAPAAIHIARAPQPPSDRVSEAIGWLEIALQMGGKLGGRRREVELALGYLRDHRSEGGAQ